ncbi:MAG: hypothetical protein ACOVOC_08110 [Rhabdaerophilum sp.]
MAEALQDYLYSHRAKPFTASLDLRLTATSLSAERGRSNQTYPLDRIERIRLYFSPRNSAHNIFVCEVRATDGASVRFDNLSWISLVQTEKLDHGFRRFVLELVARVAAQNPRLKLECGIAPLRYRLMQGAGFGLLAALMISAGYAASNGSSLVAMACLGLSVYFGFWLRSFLTRNRPGTFPADAVPDRVLPAAPIAG